MSNETGMFKLYDIRAKQQALTGEMKSRLVAALARYYRESVQADTVVLCRDARLYCAGLMDKVLEVFPRFGLNVLFNPVPVSTCQFYYSCMRHPQGGGIMITSSHNPKDYVGFKLVGKNLQPVAMGCGPEGGLEKVRSLYLADLPVPEGLPAGRLHVIQYQREYVEYSMRLAGVHPGDFSGMKVFGEFLSGSAGADFAMAMDLAGADFTLSHAVPDGLFLQGDPNPIVEASIAPAREAMRQGGYDIGFCYDGDGDRMDVMYRDGSQVLPALNMSLLIPYIMQIFRPWFGQEFRFKAYVDVKAAPIALRAIAGAGIEQHMIRNGHSFIKESLSRNFCTGYITAVEESAHYYMCFPYDPDDASKGFAAAENTLFFTLLAVKALKADPDAYRKLYELQKGLARCREWPLFFSAPEEMENVLAEVEEQMQSHGAVILKKMDDGSDLDATLMRFSLPEQITADSEFPHAWCQAAQRISRSEDAIARWEVVASDEELCKEVNALIRTVTDEYVRRGIARYEE